MNVSCDILNDVMIIGGHDKQNPRPNEKILGQKSLKTLTLSFKLSSFKHYHFNYHQVAASLRESNDILH